MAAVEVPRREKWCHQVVVVAEVAAGVVVEDRLLEVAERVEEEAGEAGIRAVLRIVVLAPETLRKVRALHKCRTSLGMALER